MRCLRQLTKEQLKATIFLSKENYDTLDDELRKNYNMEISDFGKSPNTNKKVYKVRVLPPPRSIKMKRLWHEYSLIEKEYSVPIDFHLAELDESKYEAKMYEKGSLRLGLSEKETNIDSMKEQERFSEFSLTAEISRYMNISCLTIAKEIYFTGMFTSNQGDLSVQYYDPESKRLRKYYPDFLALMEDGSYQLIEVKGDNKIDDEVVLAKKAAAEEMAVASGIHYLMYAGSTLMKSNVLEPTLVVQQASIDI